MRRAHPLRAIPGIAFQSRSELITNGSSSSSSDKPAVCLKSRPARNPSLPVFAPSIPKWRPQPSAYESVEGLIRAYKSDAEQAQARLRELTAPLPPIIPNERPATASERNDIARAAARWLAQNRGQVIEGADWYKYEPSVRAYLDPPRTLPELQQAVTRDNRDMIFTTSWSKRRPSRTAFHHG
jgi:hypothetical protein